MLFIYFKDAFSERGWYKESVDLLKGYKPAMERLGEPVTFYKIDVSG